MRTQTHRAILFGSLLYFAFAVTIPAYAQTQQPPEPNTPEAGAQQLASLGDLKLQSGAVIHDCKIGYRTVGKLNAAKSNAILWPTWLGGQSRNLLGFIGPGNVVDSGKYFVILVDAIGDGVSSSPSNSAAQPLLQFPKFTIRDMVESEYRLAMETLHLTHLHAVMGLSMGGMQTFEWIVAHPDFMDDAIPMAGSPQLTAYDDLVWTTQIEAMELDPAWHNGHPSGTFTSGMRINKEIESMNITSPAYRVEQTAPGNFDSFLSDTLAGTAVDAGTVCNMIRQREAMMALDIPAQFGDKTLAVSAMHVRAKMLVIVSPEDHLVNPTPAIAFASATGAPLLQLDSACGHNALSCISVGPIVAQFLADASSVHSETLHDAANPPLP